MIFGFFGSTARNLGAELGARASWVQLEPPSVLRWRTGVPAASVPPARIVFELDGANATAVAQLPASFRIGIDVHETPPSDDKWTPKELCPA